MSNILLVEDSPEMQTLVQSSLGPEIQVTNAETIEGAIQVMGKGNFDLLLIDVSLPDGSGYDLCGEIRRRAELQHTPVVFLTGKDTSQDKIRGYTLGADDYITKPFDPMEFQARIKGRLSRFKDIQTEKDVFVSGSLTFDKSMQRVWAGSEDNEVHLTPVEFRILYYLAKRDSQIVSRDELLRGIWQGNVNVVTQNVYTHISVIRKKLGAHANCIESIPNVGYRYARGSVAQAQ